MHNGFNLKKIKNNLPQAGIARFLKYVETSTVSVATDMIKVPLWLADRVACADKLFNRSTTWRSCFNGGR